MKTEKVSLSGNDKIMLISNMTTMLAAGIPILETIDSMLEDAKGNQKKLLEGMHEDLMQGQHISYTFSRFPHVFDKVTVNIIRAAEEAGTLDVTLQDLKTNIRNEMEFNDKIRSAMVYPSFIVVIFFAVLLMILIVVVPKVTTVFLQLKVPLPLPTRILLFLSNAVLHYTVPLVIGIVILIGIVIFLIKTQRRMIISLLTSLPIISNLAKEIDLTRFCRSLYLLLSSGIPITTALELCSEVVTRRDVSSAVAHAKEVVSSGKKLSEGLKMNKEVFPSIILKMVEAGEKTGSLDKSMQDSAEYLDYQVSSMLKTVTAMIEPLLLVVVGGLVGAMMLAIIAPIYGMIGQIQINH